MTDPTPTGYVHSFESFGTVDGPGIRNVIFLQGCHFRCLYCHNPDTWEEKGGTPTSVQELFSRIVRYKPYFESSGGGVTISGGEPLLQTAFVAGLFSLLKKEGIHTCLDTAGWLPPSVEHSSLMELIGLTDLVLLDIKHTDENQHKALTGQTGLKTLEFARLLEKHHIPVWLRYVIVPGYTDRPKDLEAFRELAFGLSNVEKVEYLPFHKLGEYKWEALGLPYRLGRVEPPDAEFMTRL